MKLYVKIILGVVIFIALACILAGIYLFRMPHKNLVKAKPDFVISAVGLQKAFEDSEKDATAKYVKKILEVSGVVVEVKTGESGALNVTLKSGSDLSSVICTLAAGADQAAFVQGSQVKLRGECSGYLMDVLLNNCVLIK
jgi:hypothetical protein